MSCLLKFEETRHAINIRLPWASHFNSDTKTITVHHFCFLTVHTANPLVMQRSDESTCSVIPTIIPSISLIVKDFPGNVSSARPHLRETEWISLFWFIHWLWWCYEASKHKLHLKQCELQPETPPPPPDPKKCDFSANTTSHASLIPPQPLLMEQKLNMAELPRLVQCLLWQELRSGCNYWSGCKHWSSWQKQ